jgi:hypothetical protein
MKTLRPEQLDIPAIAEKELREVLVAYGLNEPVLQGTAKCVVCGEAIDWFKIAGLFVKEGGLRIVCNRPGCVEEVVAQSNG